MKQLKLSKKNIYIFLLFAVLSGISRIPVKIIPLLTTTLAPAYTDDPKTFSITGNLDFQNQASLNSWVGDGSESYPYSINNLNITNSTSIVLSYLVCE